MCDEIIHIIIIRKYLIKFIIPDGLDNDVGLIDI